MAAAPITFTAAMVSTAAKREVMSRLRELPLGSSARLQQPFEELLAAMRTHGFTGGL